MTESTKMWKCEAKKILYAIKLSELLKYKDSNSGTNPHKFCVVLVDYDIVTDNSRSTTCRFNFAALSLRKIMKVDETSKNIGFIREPTDQISNQTWKEQEVYYGPRKATQRNKTVFKVTKSSWPSNQDDKRHFQKAFRIKLSELLQDSKWDVKFYTFNFCVISAAHAVVTDTRKFTTCKCKLKALS